MNIFQSVAKPKVPRSVQDLSHEHDLSCNMGELIPVSWVDVVPGTKVHMDNESLVRFMPMAAPVFDRFNVTFHRWFVPKRILWDHWDEYRSMTKLPSTGELPVHPYLTVDPKQTIPRLWNYMGIPYVSDPLLQDKSVDVDAFAMAAYQCIYHENYRDQNLIPEFDYKLVDGYNGDYSTAPWNVLRKRAWSHDYYTSALPFVQKGDPVMMPVTFNDAPVKKNDLFTPFASPGQVNTVFDNSGSATFTPIEGDPANNTDVLDGGLYADLGNSSSQTTINDFRLANAVQRFKERLARVGSRWTEFLRGVFGINSRDARLQRPEYIGGVVKPVTISEVLNVGDATLPQGNMSGHGATYISGKQSYYFCEEDGIVMTIMNIQPKGKYFQGIERAFLKINHPTEKYLPDLANLGEQPVYNDELFAYTSQGKETFGYQPRWTEHRFKNNRISGQFTTTLKHWTAAREFGNLPTLNQQFIEMEGTGSSDRIFIVVDPDEEKLLCQVWNDIKVVQPIPKMGTPSL